MTRDRYRQITQYIRYSSHSNSFDNKENKYKDFLFNLILNSNKLYKSKMKMVKFEGRAQNVVYQRDKPIKKGFKMYVLIV